jgi:hypothetical protein
MSVLDLQMKVSPGAKPPRPVSLRRILVALLVIFALFALLMTQRDVIREYQLYFTEDRQDVNFELAELSEAWSEKMLREKFPGVPLNCYSEQGKNLGDLQCVLDTKSFNGVPALFITFFFSADHLQQVSINVPWWEHQAAYDYLVASIGRQISSQDSPHAGVRLHGWRLPCGAGVFYNRDKSLNPLQWNAISWQNPTWCAAHGCFPAQAVSVEDLTCFGKPVTPESQEALANVIPLSSDKPPRELAEGAEVILISGYEPSDVSTNGTKVKVLIDRPEAKVLLVLTSYEKIVWEVEGSPQTKIVGIVTAGHEGPTIATSAQTVAYLTTLPYTYETENSKFKEILTGLNQLFGITRIDAFRGKYSIPSLVSVSELDRPGVELTLDGPKPQKPDTNFTFSLISPDFKKSKWSLTGPAQQTERSSVAGDGKVALSSAGDVLYKLADNGIEITTLPANVRTAVSIPANFPSFSWATDIALDSKRGIVSVVSLGGEGFLYRYDIKSKKWIDFRSLSDVDLLSLSYDPSSDRYVGWTDNGQLIFISGNGEALFTKKIIDRLPGFGRLYDKGNGRAPRITIVPNGNDIALLYISGNSVRRIWHYSLSSEEGMLTYQSGEANASAAQ